jgi:hypothetical protein
MSDVAKTIGIFSGVTMVLISMGVFIPSCSKGCAEADLMSCKDSVTVVDSSSIHDKDRLSSRGYTKCDIGAKATYIETLDKKSLVVTCSCDHNNIQIGNVISGDSSQYSNGKEPKTEPRKTSSSAEDLSVYFEE